MEKWKLSKTGKNSLKATAFLLIIYLSAGFISPVLADAAPPPPPAGSDLYPSIENTNVRMVSERVLIDVIANDDNPYGEAKVTAQFFMRNLGDTEEFMHARFPMNSAEYLLEWEMENRSEYCGEISPYPQIEEIKIWVDGVVADARITTKYVEDYNKSSIENKTVYKQINCWAYFDVLFPPQQDVEIKVSYTAYGYKPEPQSGQTEFAYVIGTGAGWKDTIGKADIIARLPYDVSYQNVLSCYPEDCQLSGKDILWHYEDFEPEGNIIFRIVFPSIWQIILTETEIIEKNPNDGEAWGRLGKAYKESIWVRRGFWYYDPAEEIYYLSKDAYQKAVDLLPEDADWHYGFADLLCWNAEWDSFGPEEWRETKNWVDCVEQLKSALDINPSHEKANELLQFIHDKNERRAINLLIVDLSGDDPDYLILTPSANYTTTTIPPTLTSTPKPQVVIQASDTPTPANTLLAPTSEATAMSGDMDTPASKPNNALVYISALLLAAIAGFVVVKSNRK
ncbi:MAG: hypothetical protein OEY93_10320 [Anaerolineae bacterium]|nr:hypothetical protein [Anaerolineae bacterium]